MVNLIPLICNPFWQHHLVTLPVQDWRLPLAVKAFFPVSSFQISTQAMKVPPYALLRLGQLSTTFQRWDAAFEERR
jgi:hypothetical protein